MIHMNSATVPNENLQAVIDGTEVYENGGAFLTGGAIEHARVASIITALVFEINTGMKMTRFPITKVVAQYGINAKTKKKCLQGMLAYYKTFYGVEWDDKNGRVAKALAK